MKRATAVIAGLLLVLGLGASGALAQEPDEDSPVTTESTTTVLGSSTTNTTASTTTTTEASTTTTEASTTTETVGGASSTPTTAATQETEDSVLGAVTRRPLPRTGNDIGGTAIFGGALTVLGIALALGARKRRNSFDGV